MSSKPIEPALVNLVRQYLFPDIVDDTTVEHVLISFNGKVHTWAQLKDLLSKVAISNDYNDLDNLPSIDNIVRDELDIHNGSIDAHSNLFQIVNTGDEVIGLDDGGIYFEVDNGTKNDDEEEEEPVNGSNND